MFTIPDVAVVLRRLQLKIEDADTEENDAGHDPQAPQIRRLCECTFRVNLLTLVIARATPLPIVRHCFGSDELPQWDLSDVHFQPPEAAFLVELRTAPDMPDALASFAASAITKVRVWRPKQDNRDLRLEFVTRHEIDRNDIRALAEVLTAWETGSLYVTMTEVRPPLFEEIENDAQPQYRGSKTH